MSDGYEIVPLSPLRKIVAARMTEAKRNIPHYRLVADIQVDELLSLRKRENSLQLDGKITLNDCLIKGCAHALVEHPDINCQLVDGQLHRFRDADISVVVAVEGGLSTPIVRSANRKTIQEIAAEMRSLSERALARQLRMDEILGGSFSISNLGSYGVDQFDAVINPPQCAILAIGRARSQVIAGDDNVPKVAQVLCATLSVDHRAIDGASAAQFLRTLRQVFERPQTLFIANER